MVMGGRMLCHGAAMRTSNLLPPAFPLYFASFALKRTNRRTDTVKQPLATNNG